MKVGTDFSGIGAPEMALKYLGIDFDSVFACEIDKYARKSFEQLHKPKTFYNDITKRNHKEIEQLDLYVAGFPCQAFSMAGKRKGFDEARGTLFFNVAEFIQINQPKVFVLENVKGLLSHDRGKTFQTIVDILSNGGGTKNGQISLDVFDDGLGYHIYWEVLNTKNYGIPQNRERIFIVGFKDYKSFSFPKEIPLQIELKDILQDNKNYVIVKSGDYQPYPRNYKDLNLPRKERFEKRNDNISNCLRTNASYIEVDKKIRRLTPLECWRLQGFKDNDFYKVKDVSDTQLYKQAGNSITVNVLMHLFKKIYGNNK
jgi:DNA (cytosine-5)-methyltransferase 1